MRDSITPVILTLNEDLNIGRTLGQLTWARAVVLVDSGSIDDTVAIACTHKNVHVYERAFDSHAAQWNYAVSETGIQTDWILALDADYVLTEELIEELSSLRPGPEINGFRGKFRYCVGGRPLRASVYPPVTVLFRRDKARYEQDGHTQRLVIEGGIGRLRSEILHDDRKPFSRWLAAQDRYMRLETEKLVRSRWSALSWPDRIRAMRFVAPVAMALYCLLWKRLVLDGRAGMFYTLQRIVAELLLSLYLIGRDLGIDIERRTH